VGKKVSELYPSLGGAYSDLEFIAPCAKTIAPLVDFAFVCLPHGASSNTCLEILEFGGKNIKVIDLSADFRYDDVELYEKIYSVTHPNAKVNAKAVYGLSELYRDKIKSAQIVANPGCYPTSAILALKPLLDKKIISPKNIVVDSKSGASGAGRQANEAFSICELSNNFKAYGVTTHRHTSEIEEKLGLTANDIPLSFTPHLLPIKRGILSTIYADIICDCSDINICVADAYNSYYKKEAFIKVKAPSNPLPELSSVVGSNCCHIGYKIGKRTNKIIIVSCIDNLIKGASGAAVQNMNIMCGFSETEGLPKAGNQL